MIKKWRWVQMETPENYDSISNWTEIVLLSKIIQTVYLW